MRMVVSDTSALSNFLYLGHFDWLGVLFDEVVMPPAVHAELTQLSRFQVDLAPLVQATFLQTVSPRDTAAVQALRARLDPGEAEAIVLAEELAPTYLVIDELLGRAEARKKGIAIVGTLGLLVQAKQRGLTTQIKPLMEQLRQKGFWINEKLFQKVLAQVGE